MRFHSLLVLVFCALLFPAAQAQRRPQHWGGGTSVPPVGDCITPQERELVQQNIARYHALHGGITYGITEIPQSYPFFPQAGNLYDDLFVNNYVDLDPTSGILDWDGTDRTYNGHRGHDVDLRTFGEQDIGVPIFAALDGDVVDAHDGEFDKNTAFNNSPANYVILWHGGSHYTYYWHMRRNSVAVQIGQRVRMGTQLGMTASSGNSTGPHLHFESWANNTWFEPSAGFARPGDSNWVNQVPVRREMYFRDFNLTNVDLSQYSGLPYDMPRIGTFLIGTQRITWWINLMNMPAGSNWRVRIRRPNNSVVFDSGTANYNNAGYYRWSWWWWSYFINFDTVGNWQVELTINGQYIQRAPFRVVAAANEIVNRAPKSVLAAFDPPRPTTNEVLFCRVSPDLFDDPDYDIVRYRYLWKINGRTVRDVTTAANSDALPAGIAESCDTVECTVTPKDAALSASSTVIQTNYLGNIRVSIAGQVTLQDSVNPAQNLLLELRPVCGLPTLSYSVLLDAQGRFTLSGIPNAEYMLAAKGSKWLRKTQAVNAESGDQMGVAMTLRAGDIAADNRVDIADLTELIATYNTTESSANWNSQCDLNSDGRADITDLLLLISNYNMTGDP